MDIILEICKGIIIVWWAICMVILTLIMLLLLKITIKLSKTVSEIIWTYVFIKSIISSPFATIIKKFKN